MMFIADEIHDRADPEGVIFGVSDEAHLVWAEASFFSHGAKVALFIKFGDGLNF